MSPRSRRASSRTWQSSAARELMRMSNDGDPRTAIVQRARALLEEAQVTSAPVDFNLLGSFQYIHTINAAPMKAAGRLVPDAKGFQIHVNAAHTIGKQRFTIGHEIGHTLVPTYQRAPYVIQDLVTGLFSGGKEEEYLCDIAASALLLPEHLFRPQAMERGLHLETVATLSRLFKASREATARRLVDMNLWPCAVAMWHLAYKKSQASGSRQLSFDGFGWVPPVKKLRLRYAAPSSSFGHFLPSNISAPADGPLTRCYEENQACYGEERLTTSSGDASLFVMAAPVDYCDSSGPQRQVLSLLLDMGATPPSPVRYTELWDAGEGL